MRVGYRTVAVAAALLLAACNSTAPEQVAIVAHYVPACAPDVSLPPTQLTLTALGDFDPSTESVSVLSSGASRTKLELPRDTRAVELGTLGNPSYSGTGLRDARGQISVLLWPEASSCSLADSEVPPLADGSWLFGVSTSSPSLLCLATAPESTASVGLTLDLGSATPTALERGLVTARRFASLSELGAAQLVAGGIAPETQAYLADAELFDPAARSFQSPSLTLSTPRARHAALSLPSGATLLIGGESAPGRALDSVEVIAADAAHSARASRLLGTPRVDPTALLLGDGRILIGGGFVWAASGTSAAGAAAARQPLSSVEFLSSDLADVTLAPVLLDPAALDRAFVPLLAGSALAVGGCNPVPEPGCLPCEGGSGCISRAVWWLDAQGTAHALEPLPEALSSATPHLVAAAEGAPWLIAGTKLGRFDPWEARFHVVTDLALDPLDHLLGEPRALGPGAFGWLRQDGDAVQVFGLYTDQRSAFSQDIAPLLVGGVRGVVPHRPPVTASGGSDVTLSYDVASGLALAGTGAVVSIADSDYADFTLDLTLASGPPPLLRLTGGASAGNESAAFGGLGCAWPDFDPPSGDTPQSKIELRVRRQGNDVYLLLGGDDAPHSATSGASLLEPEPCRRPLPDRVQIELAGTPLGTTELTRLAIRRSTK